MSVLEPLWEPAAPVIKKTRSIEQQIEMERLAYEKGERSPRRRFGVKAHLKSWATGDSSTVGMWRLCHAVCTQDGTNAGLGMGRLAGLATSERSSSEQNCARELRKLLAVTSLPKMIQAVPHTKGEDTVTHTLPPVGLIRLIHTHNRTKFGQIFGACPVKTRGILAISIRQRGWSGVQAATSCIKEQRPRESKTFDTDRDT